MNWDKKSVIATLVCFLFVMGYMYHLQNKYPDYYSNAQQSSELAPESVLSPAAGTAPDASPATPTPAAPTLTPGTEAPPQLSETDLTFENAQRVVRFEQAKGSIASVHLKDYAAHKGKTDPVNILDDQLIIQGTTTPTDRTMKGGYSAKREGNKISFSRTEGTWEITQTYTVPTEGYGLDIDVSFRNTSEQEQVLRATSVVRQYLNFPTESGSFLLPASPSDVGITYSIGGKSQESPLQSFCEEGEDAPLDVKNEKLDYLGFDKHYFLGLVWTKQAADYLVQREPESNGKRCAFSTVMTQEYGSVPAGSITSMKLASYFGPKRVDALEAYGPELKSTIKLGWFSIVAHPLLLALKSIYQGVGNWGLAIIIVTVILKLAFYPLTRAAAISARRMQKLQPEMTALRERLKDDPARQQRELMAFMSQNKVNPFKGCLPILPQIPVFIAFYNVLSQAIELRHAPFFGWIIDLSSKDPYYITPILLGVFTFVQQKLTPTPGMDKNQQKIMLMMPIVFSLMMLSLPAGMALYTLTNTLVSIAQQQWLNRRLALKEAQVPT